MMKHVFLAAALVLASVPASAQVTYYHPTPNGGYTATTPGAPNGTTFYNPTPYGGYTAITPGAPNGTTFYNPTPNGGFMAITPGAPMPPPYPNRYR